MPTSFTAFGQAISNGRASDWSSAQYSAKDSRYGPGGRQQRGATYVYLVKDTFRAGHLQTRTRDQMHPSARFLQPGQEKKTRKNGSMNGKCRREGDSKCRTAAEVCQTRGHQIFSATTFRSAPGHFIKYGMIISSLSSVEARKQCSSVGPTDDAKKPVVFE